MAEGRAEQGEAFLTVDEAARRLGVSRLRVREAAARGLMPSRRDNEGRLRVDLPPKAPEAGDDLAPDAIIGFLFDDIEDLEATLALRGAERDSLAALAARQDAALSAAGEALDAAAAREARLTALLDRAMSHLEAETGALERSLDQTARFEAALARAVALAETGAGPDLSDATDRALALLEDAVGRAEAGEAGLARAETLLGKAMDAAERLARENADKDAALAASAEETAARTKELDAALTMTERATDLAAAVAADRGRRGWLRRLLGL